MVDHYLVYGIRKMNAWRRKGNKPKVIESRNMKKCDKTLFRKDLEQVDWENILSPFDNDPVSMAAMEAQLLALRRLIEGIKS